MTNRLQISVRQTPMKGGTSVVLLCHHFRPPMRLISSPDQGLNTLQERDHPASMRVSGLDFGLTSQLFACERRDRVQHSEARFAVRTLSHYEQTLVHERTQIVQDRVSALIV